MLIYTLIVFPASAAVENITASTILDAVNTTQGTSTTTSVNSTTNVTSTGEESQGEVFHWSRYNIYQDSIGEGVISVQLSSIRTLKVTFIFMLFQQFK